MKTYKAKWMMYTKKADFDGIAERFGISPVTARILRNRDLMEEEEIGRFLRADLSEMYDPFLMKDVKKATDILNVKINENKKIRIIGDYDADGVCASVILYKGLTSLGASADTDVPDRMTDGYGLNIRLVDAAKADGIDTIITCDNGIAACEAAEHAKQLGMTLIITDHHEPQDRMPDADAVIDPKQKDCGYPFKELCGAGVAYKLMTAMGVNAELLRQLLKFAAFATICDIVKLQDENRIIAKNGLRLINEDEAVLNGKDTPGYNKGLRALIENTGLLNKKIRSYETGFILGPCVNAGGRLGSAKTGIELFLEEDTGRCTELARELTDHNTERKSITETATGRACEIIEKECEDDVIVAYMPDCHEAVAGIVAGRIKDRFNRPAFVLTNAEDGTLKGSGRSIDEYNMFEELKKCEDLLIRYGGHKKAAGLSIEKDKLKEFSDRINDNASLTQEDLTKKIWIDVPMYADYPMEKFIEELSALEPFGEGNKKPLFADKGLTVEDVRLFGENQNVLKMVLRTPRGKKAEAVKFINDRSVKLPQKGDSIRITYYPEINEFGGFKRIQLKVDDFEFET